MWTGEHMDTHAGTNTHTHTHTQQQNAVINYIFHFYSLSPLLFLSLTNTNLHSCVLYIPFPSVFPFLCQSLSFFFFFVPHKRTKIHAEEYRDMKKEKPYKQKAYLQEDDDGTIM